MCEKGVPPQLVTHTNNTAELVALKDAAAAGGGALLHDTRYKEHRDVLVVGGGAGHVRKLWIKRMQTHRILRPVLKAEMICKNH